MTNTVTGAVAQFYYDGDGKRVKKVEGGQTTVYVGAQYEKNVTTGAAYPSWDRWPMRVI